MKTLRRLATAILVSCSFCLISCNDDDGGSDNNNNNNNGGAGEFVQAKVNGQDFTSSTLFDAVAASRPNATTVMIQGSDNGGKAIQIMMLNFNGAGTYNLSSQTAGQMLYTVASPFASYSSAMGSGATGEVVVTAADDSKIEGTFTFTGKNTNDVSQTVTVTEGKFRANFQ